MQKGKIKVIALLGAFILTVFIVGLINRHSNKDTTAQMEEASLPVVSVYYENQQINQLYGHTTEMNALYMRDSITPLKNDRILPVAITTYGEKVDGISYEIRSMDTKRLVAESEVSDYSMKEDIVEADIKVQNIIEEGKEYLFILKLEQGKKEIYYYTRIIQPVDSYVKESLDFVMNFHDSSMNKETGGTLATYLEPDASADNTSLQKVTIHSSLKQLTWADFKCHQVKEPIPSIKEIDSMSNVITLKYVVSCEGDNGDTEYYNVEEYYRVRYTKDRTYLLNYERTMNQIFVGEKDSVSKKSIQLGIRSKDVNYKANENGMIAAFVQEGDLWSYNRNTNQMAKVFSFRSDAEEIDDRENYDQHDIRIVNVDEGGSIEFLVYGYMNRGGHEGKTGISVYRYDAMTNTVEESLFLPVTTSYQVMKEDLGELAYQNNEKQFFLVSGSSLYQIDSETLEVTEKMKDLKKGEYAVSESGRYIAYKKDGSLLVEDLESGSSHEVEEGGQMRALGFIGEDFIYGTARGSGESEPMYQVQILSPDEGYEVVKTYQKSGYYISDVRVEGSTIYLSRVREENGTYQEATEDTIVNSEEEEAVQMEIQTSFEKDKQVQIQIGFAETSKEETFKRLTSKEIVHKEPKEVEIELTCQKKYYAYSGGKVITGADKVSAAIKAADAQMGVVVGQEQQYIWKRSKKASRESLIAAGTKADGAGSIEQCLLSMLKREELNLDVGTLLAQGETPNQILKEAMQEYEVLDLTGCSLEQILYYVSMGAPVFAMTGANQAVLVTGYDSTGVYIYETSSQNVTRQSLEEAGGTFAAAGNIFYSYLK